LEGIDGLKVISEYRYYGGRPTIFGTWKSLIVYLELVGSAGMSRIEIQASGRHYDVLTFIDKLWELYPIRKATEDHTVPVTFHYGTAQGHAKISRNITVPPWRFIQGNYSPEVHEGLSPLFGARKDLDLAAGKLLLWHGSAGTGKTYALRSLAWEVRSWCSMHYVVDPDAMLGGRTDYLVDIILDEDGVSPDQWKLLILEDSGELITADAKRNTGQALSRLLNLLDGILGQGLKTMVIITTNEEVAKFHEAIMRPGRCLSNVEFGPLSIEQGREWMAARGKNVQIHRSYTLAQLYALEADRSAGEMKAQHVGF
jgi:hypothetical protein